MRDGTPDYVADPATGCWLWQGAISHGYGRKWANGRLRPAHVVYWEREHGPVPEGLELDHLCRVRCCCNPSHLEPVTRAENIRRGLRAKLTADQVDAIRARCSAERISQRALAVEYGVTHNTIGAIIRGQAWL